MFTKLLAAIFLALLFVFEGTCVLNNLKRNSKPNEGDVRLSGSNSPSKGRVEVYHDGKWGSVCDDNWSLVDAEVVCHQLNFQRAISAVTGGHFGQASGNIWLDNVDCNGREQKLVSCGFPGWGVHDCSHIEDAGVVCDTEISRIQEYNVTQRDSTHSLIHSTTLSDDLGKLFDSGTACDFLITFQTPTVNKQNNGTPEETETTICAHKAILMLYPYFNASAGENNITVTVNTTCRSYFTSFIRYLYTRQINVTDSSAMCLHQLAFDFGLMPLMEHVGRVISKSLPDDASFYSQVSLYKYVVETKDLILKNSCIQYLAWNFQNLTSSPVWAELPVELLHVLLTRSDLVVPDEYFVLQILESWITNNHSSLSSESQVDLLRLVRFPMIPAEKLHELESNSALFNTHRDLYHNNVFKAYHFNVLLNGGLNKLVSGRENDDYKPRIYTSKTWSIAIDSLNVPLEPQRLNQYSSYDYLYDSLYSDSTPTPPNNLLQTPPQTSVVCNDNMITWETNVFNTMSECSKEGVHCRSVPAARLVRQSYNNLGSNTHYDNLVLLTCQNRYICQIQGFHNNMAYINTDDQPLTYPCPDYNYIYTFVVRPEFV